MWAIKTHNRYTFSALWTMPKVHHIPVLNLYVWGLAYRASFVRGDAVHFHYWHIFFLSWDKRPTAGMSGVLPANQTNITDMIYGADEARRNGTGKTSRSMRC
jgi:hypothetical protein